MVNFEDSDLKIVADFVAAELKKQGIYVEMDGDSPYVGGAIFNGIDGFYFNYPNYPGSFDVDKVSNLFPMGVGFYTVFFVTASDPELDDDRYYKASIGFTYFHEDD